MFRSLFIVLLGCIPLLAQSDSGELRLHVADKDGLGLASTVRLQSEANQYDRTLRTDEDGFLLAKRLPFGLYRLTVSREGFASHGETLEIRTGVPIERRVTLGVGPITTSLDVDANAETLIDPERTGSVNRIGTEAIDHRVASLPGRSLQDLINLQPGWLYEGNAVLHPRGSEYQTQFVLDGVPLTDNRSPGLGSEITASDVESLSIYTAGIPAEYGRKLGGIVEVNTARDTTQGLHGQATLSGASFGTGSAFANLQYARNQTTLSLSSSGAMTDRYLNPPVLQNFTNSGTSGSFAASLEQQLNQRDRVGFELRHELSRFLVPNELVQESAGQRQDRENFETLGIGSYEHVFSPDMVGDFRAMVRDDSGALKSNSNSTPIIANQKGGFREIYFKATVGVHRKHHEWKAGFELDNTFLSERLSYDITNPGQFDPGTPPTFSFTADHPDLEQSAFVQDRIHAGSWNISLGLRYDHYQLLLNEHGVSPRIGISRYFPDAGLLIHASYDRVFQTPAFENILLSSSPQVASLNPEVLRLPVRPSRGNYFEVGLTKGLWQRMRLDVNGFDRRVGNFADDDQLLDTGLSFPISFRKARVYGAEGKLTIPQWGRFSGLLSYSYMVGSAYLPVTGGLFLGSDAANALATSGGSFWVSQDQRNSVRSRLRYQLFPKLWTAVDVEYGSGLPVEFDGTRDEAVVQFGEVIVDRVNLERGRVKPSLAVTASVGTDLWRKDRFLVQMQVDGQNLNNRLNLMNFEGVFSGNAIAPPRSYAVRLTTSF